MIWVWLDGQVGAFSFFGFCGLGRAVPEAEAVVSGFENVAVMGEPIEQRGCHFGVAKHAGPFGKAEIGGDDDTGVFF